MFPRAHIELDQKVTHLKAVVQQTELNRELEYVHLKAVAQQNESNQEEEYKTKAGRSTKAFLSPI